MVRASKSKVEVEKHNGHVSLGREEYDALMSREESYAELVATNANSVNRAHDLVRTCDAQAQRLNESILMMEHLKRVTDLQAEFIALLRTGSGVASIEDLSEFWKQWQIAVGNAIKDRNLSQDEVNKYEPDLFKTWRNWVNSAGMRDQVLAEAGTRTMTRAEHSRATTGEDVEAPQDRAIRQLREDNEKLKMRQAQLEAELDRFKSGNQPPLVVKIIKR